ncbi:hypothetical protein [uncultured Fibrobacter sp.]|uniref:hypothetical protein n=1 Tax=uncultured Fibrobacter sp. TaxID=261512 RepID=UPI002629A851|nr:hypothetical protein [uncultured Fibrobacter sp.]
MEILALHDRLTIKHAALQIKPATCRAAVQANFELYKKIGGQIQTNQVNVGDVQGLISLEKQFCGRTYFSKPVGGKKPDWEEKKDGKVALIKE